MLTPTPQIRQAFYKKLISALPVNDLTEDDVAWPNTKFRPDPDRVYIAPALLFSETRIASLSPRGYEELAGIFQITVYGVAGTGEAEPDYLAQYFTDVFRGGQFLELPCKMNISIRKAWRSQLYFDNSARPWLTVSVDWHQFTQKGV